MGQESAGRPTTLSSQKISPNLGATLDRLNSAGVTRDSMGSYDLEQFSNPLVRVDQHGRVQVYIYVDRLDDAALRELQAAGVTVELTHSQPPLVQGWVPFYLLESIAQLPNVTRIRPPDYAVPRSRKVNPPEESKPDLTSR